LIIGVKISASPGNDLAPHHTFAIFAALAARMTLAICAPRITLGICDFQPSKKNAFAGKAPFAGRSPAPAAFGLRGRRTSKKLMYAGRAPRIHQFFRVLKEELLVNTNS
jgi:hypothetical protein